MSIITDLFARLFSRLPRYQVAASDEFTAAIVGALAREGVTVGGTASYPRIEVHTVTEQARQDKEGVLRQITFIVESVSNTSTAEAMDMNATNMQLLTAAQPTLGNGTSFTCIGIIPDQLQSMVETSDTNKILYRLLQSYTAWVEAVKTEDEEQDNEEEN